MHSRSVGSNAYHSYVAGQGRPGGGGAPEAHTHHNDVRGNAVAGKEGQVLRHVGVGAVPLQVQCKPGTIIHPVQQQGVKGFVALRTSQRS